MTRTALTLALLLTLLVACRKANEEEAPTTQSSTITSTVEPATPAGMTIGDLQTPESVLYDPEQDVYFISNINGGFLDVDDNGFISRVSPDSGKVDLKWIAGGTNGVTLHGPKGMAIVGDSLYVSDINAVRKFDRRSGAPQGEIPVPGATFLNDLTTDGHKVWLSDTGITPGPGNTFVAHHTDAIWEIENDRGKKIASGSELSQPNGLCWANGNLWVASFAGADLYQLAGDHRSHVDKLPTGQLDGLVCMPDGGFAVTSWMGSTVYRGPAGGPFKSVVGAVNAPADIGYDTKRHRLLLPRPTENQVTVHPLE